MIVADKIYNKTFIGETPIPLLSLSDVLIGQMSSALLYGR